MEPNQFPFRWDPGEVGDLFHPHEETLPASRWHLPAACLACRGATRGDWHRHNSIASRDGRGQMMPNESGRKILFAFKEVAKR